MLLGLDLGTTNVKAALVKRNGRVVARGSASVQLFHVGEHGVEQDIEDIWEATVSAIKDLGGRSDLALVEAVGVSSQGGALQLLDGSGCPLGRVISWLDGRARSYNEALTSELGGDWFAEHAGHGACGTAAGQLLRLRAEEPERMALVRDIGFVGDVIVSRLCGRRAHDATSLSLAALFNPQLCAADPDLLSRLGIAEGQLPALSPAREVAGGLLRETADLAGLPAGIPVSPAVHDQYAAALGCGAVHAGDVMFGAGTAWVLLAVSEQMPGPAAAGSFVCTHVVEGLYGQIVSLANGGSSFSWAVDVLGLADRSSEEIDDLLERAPAGSDGVRFWPFLVPGGGAGLGSRAAARLVGLRFSHGPPHILRAVVEGLALELGRHLKLLTDSGVSVERLIMCGGAAGGRVTPQIIADVTGLPVACLSETEISALGGAVIARALVEPEANIVRLAEEMTSARKQIEPGPVAAFHHGLFEEYLDSLPTVSRERTRP